MRHHNNHDIAIIRVRILRRKCLFGLFSAPIVEVDFNPKASFITLATLEASVDQDLTALIVLSDLYTVLLRNYGMNREYVHCVAIYQKYLTRFRELIIFEPWRENNHFSLPN